MLAHQVIGQSAQILSADFAIDVVEQLRVDLRIIKSGIFESTLPAPKRSHRVNAPDQIWMIAFNGRDIQRFTAGVKLPDFPNH